MRIRKPGYNQTDLETGRRVFYKIFFLDCNQTDSETGPKEEKRNDQLCLLLVVLITWNDVLLYIVLGNCLSNDH